MKRYIYIIFSVLSLAFLFSCTDILEKENTEVCPTNGIADGDFVISMNIPSLNVSSRSDNIANDPENGAESWSTWEKFCDGTLLYRVTLFVVDGDGTLVGYRDFYKGSSDIQAENSEYGGNGFYANNAVSTDLSNGIAVKATFKANKPMHGAIEKLQAKTYKVYAVANYAPITTENAATVGVTTGETYLGLGTAKADTDANSTILNGESSGSTNDFTTIVNGVINSFGETAGVANFNENTAFFNYKLNAGTDRVCKIQPQPLVMIRDVDLSQTNNLSGQLARTFARIRLTVQNVNTGTAQIGISGLSFNNAYASQKAFLFNDVGTTSGLNLHNHFDLYESTTSPDDAELNTKGLLNVSSDDAIIDFNSDEGYRLIPGTKRHIFDCYLLEGMIANTTAFSFTATYWTSATGGNATENIQITNWDAFLYDSNDYRRQVFIRKNTSDSKYLLEANETKNENGYTTGGVVKISDEEQANAYDNATDALDPIYIWEVQPTEEEPSGTTTYGELFSIGTGLYLQPYDGNSDYTIKLDFNQTGGKILFNIYFQDTDEKGSIYCVYNGNYYYISSEGKWVNTNIAASNETSPPSSDNGYKRLTFETIAGVAGTAKTKEISKTIEMSAETTTGNNVIVRNDFFWGTIPLYVNEQNLGVSLSAYELAWYVGDESTSKSVTVTTRDSNYTWSIENSNSSAFTVVKNDNGTITVTPINTANPVTGTVTVTCSNGDKVTLSLVVKERPVAQTKTITLSFNYNGRNGTTTIDNGNVTETTEIGTLTHNGGGSYTYTLTYTEEDLSKNITFSYSGNGNNNTYTKTMTIEEFVNSYNDVGSATITLARQQNN